MSSVGLCHHQQNSVCLGLSCPSVSPHSSCVCPWVEGMQSCIPKLQGWLWAVWGAGRNWFLQVPGVCARRGCPSWQGQRALCPPCPEITPSPPRGLCQGQLALQEGAGLCQEQTQPGGAPCGARGASAVLALHKPCPVSHGKGWAAPALPWSLGRAVGGCGVGPGQGGTDWPERGQGLAQGLWAQPELGWAAMERDRTLQCPSCGGTAGNKPAAGFGINSLFSKGTGRRFVCT